jgi:hypothetical protein
LLSASLIALCTFTSCSKDDQPTPQTTQPSCRITTFYNVDPSRDSVLHQYDQQGRLFKRIWFFSGKQTGELTLEYTEQGHLAKSTHTDHYLDYQQQLTSEVTDVATYEYNSNGQIAKFNSVRNTKSANYALPPVEVIYEYDQLGNRTKVTKNFAGTTTQAITEFVYLKGNCIKAIYNPNQSNEVVVEYEHYLDRENKQAPFFLSVYSSEPTPDKNMLKKVTRTDKQYPSSNYSYQLAYDYNAYGLPVQTTIEFVGHTYSYTSTTRSEYDCK